MSKKNEPPKDPPEGPPQDETQSSPSGAPSSPSCAGGIAFPNKATELRLLVKALRPVRSQPPPKFGR